MKGKLEALGVFKKHARRARELRGQERGLGLYRGCNKRLARSRTNHGLINYGANYKDNLLKMKDELDG